MISYLTVAPTNFVKKSLIFIFPLLFVYALYNLFYLSKVFPKTEFAHENLSGLDKKQVTTQVLTKINSFEERPLVFEIGQEKIEIRSHDLGIKSDKFATVEKIMTIGRTGELGKDLVHKLKAPLVKTELSPIYQIDYPQLAQTLELSFSKYETRTKNATIVFTNNQLQIAQSTPGKVINRLQLLEIIFERIDQLSPKPIGITFIEEQPLISDHQATKALEKVQTLVTQNLVLSFGRERWQLTAGELFKFLKFYPYGQKGEYLERVNFGGGFIILLRVELSDSPEPLLDVSLDNFQINNFIEEVSQSIDRPTRNATAKFEGGKISEFTPAQDGQKLDKTKTRQLILEKISIDNVTGEQEIAITLPVTITRAKVESAEINSLGIRELLGRGLSFFAGSIPNRAHNISLGAKRISGTLVPPGEIFSFNKSVGEVAQATGYKQAYVITSGRTVLDDGGGICQVSTTVFRAALEAGLPIVARTAHAYRVSYYEQGGFKPGFDATVWAPAVDFQFKNDTSHYLLVQAMVDYSQAKLQVDIYGTSDGRSTQISEPVISNQRPPLPDKYQEDPTHSKGTVKQVDFAAAGATVQFTRKVFKGRNLLIDETFRSDYRPWQAVYLVGTGT